MHLSSLLLFMGFEALVECASRSDWCYTGCEHTPGHWKDIAGTFCGEDRQSPINIVTSAVHIDENLHNFTFTNFSSQHAFKSFKINTHTAKVVLESSTVELSEGGLNGTYSTIQLHFHWGDTEHHPGSEHTIDGTRYPMEMHIVSLKKGLEKPTEDPAGIAVLGFFIETTEDDSTTGPWGTLTSYLTDNTASEVAFNDSLSIKDLIGNTSLTKFYRYMGSLTTPDCNEAVVWTVFQEPIRVNKDLISLFPNVTGVSNVYRPPQPINGRQVYASPATSLPTSHSWCYDNHCHFSPSNWHLLPDSYCSGVNQSPINIDTKTVKIDTQLKEFTDKNFDNKHAIKYIVNTGHAIKCVLKEDFVEISGGGLGATFTVLQFHFHWGNSSDDSQGSEHTVDSHRYLMEMHIVSKKKDLSLGEAVQTTNGLAVLGFFLEPIDSTKSSGVESDHHETSTTSEPTSNMDVWGKLTSYLPFIQNISSQVNVTEEISIDDLLGDVSRTRYYRYNGSLTTPSCNEAVVWTVFKEPIKVDRELLRMFPNNAGYHNVFRPVRNLHSRTVFTTASASSGPGPVLLFLLLACLCTLSNNLNM